MRADVDASGPMFDGRAVSALSAFEDAAIQEVAERGKDMILAEFGTVLKHPTGYYESQVRTDRQVDDWTINDGGVVYGPWLEGTSSRNDSTRFKGYSTFRRVKQRLTGRSGGIAERVLQPFLRRMQ